jgi:hypothetical protein
MRCLHRMTFCSVFWRAGTSDCMGHLTWTTTKQLTVRLSRSPRLQRIHQSLMATGVSAYHVFSARSPILVSIDSISTFEFEPPGSPTRISVDLNIHRGPNSGVKVSPSNLGRISGGTSVSSCHFLPPSIDPDTSSTSGPISGGQVNHLMNLLHALCSVMGTSSSGCSEPSRA